jgi:drug/metabolite transporter (DMT)-like permease
MEQEANGHTKSITGRMADRLGVNRSDLLPLSLILLAGAVLRFWDYGRVPFTYDDFSAFSHARLEHLREVIQWVKIGDTHPPGVEVFLYFWVRVAGQQAWLVKLPFTLCGLFSIYLGYRIAARWFNGTVGIFTALFLSVLQYPIFYSQVARPYPSGLFLCLLMAWFWTGMVLDPGHRKWLNRIGYVAAGSLCAYNHHFSLLFAGMAAVSGLFFTRRRGILTYLLCNLAIALLYLPNLPIFFAQLSKGGVEGWLGKPHPEFFLQYLGYILHYSLALYFLAAMLVLAGILVMRSRQGNRHPSFRLMAFLWFAVPFLTGFFYSLFVNSVLQYSVLLFFYPFLVMFVFSFFRETGTPFKTASVVIFSTVAILTLVFERQHYRYFYASGYRCILEESLEVNKTFGRENTLTLLSTHPNLHRYYLDRMGVKDTTMFVMADGFMNGRELREYLLKRDQGYCIYAWAEQPRPEFIKVIEEFYPWMIKKETWFTSDFYVFSREKPAAWTGDADRRIFCSINGFETPVAGWSPAEGFLNGETVFSGAYSIRFDSLQEFGPSFKARLDTLIDNMNNILFAGVAACLTDSACNPLLVSEIRAGDKILDWRAVPFRDFIDWRGTWQKVWLVVKLSDLYIREPAAEISIYVWNRDKGTFYIDDFGVETREGNQVIYGLFKKF